MEDSFVQLNDLPDEILIIILKKLHNSEALYSLIGVNKRLDTIVQDSIFTSYFTLIPFRNDLKQFPNKILDRVCLEILPKIHYKIQRLSVDSSCMDRILLSTNYPNLRELALYDLASETVRDLFTGKTSLEMCLLNNIYLRVDFNSLQRVTDNFTRDATRINCAKIKCLILYNEPELSLDLKDYFPHAEIL